MKLGIFLSFFYLVINLGCDHAPKRTEGSCLNSSVYGGPFLVKQDGWNLIVVDPKNKIIEKKLPNDYTWAVADCPR